MFELLRILPLSVWELAEDTFEHEPLRAAIGASGVQDYRHGPRAGGTGFVLLHHLVGAPLGSLRGRMPWKGSPVDVVDAAERAAKKLGVTIRTGARVERLRVENDAVTGVVLVGGDVLEARAVISTADPSRTLLDWVDPVWLDPELLHAVQNIRYRGCTAFVMYALDALPDGISREALAGLVSLTPSLVALEKAADAVKYGTVSERPHVEITVPTLLWPELAPRDKHVLVARVQYAPYKLRDGTWDAARRDALAESVTKAISGVSPSFASHVLHRAAWTPLDIEQRYGLREGAVSQGELGLDQILFMRPVAGWGRHATPIAGLYLGGSSTHPGPGVIGGAGWLAARRLVDDRKRS
jgi:phytoene dehydrogenase-like protein